MTDNDPVRGSDLPPVPPTAPPAVPVGDPAGKHAAVPGPLIGPHGEPIPPTSPGDPLTRAESAALAEPLAAQAEHLADEVTELRVSANRLRRVTGWLIAAVVVAVGLAVVACVLLHRQSTTTAFIERSTTCQAEQNDAFRAASEQLRAANAKERDAQRQLFDILLDPNTTADQRRAASVNYRATLIEADQQRVDSQFPSGNCS